MNIVFHTYILNNMFLGSPISSSSVERHYKLKYFACSVVDLRQLYIFDSNSLLLAMTRVNKFGKDRDIKKNYKAIA